MDTYVLVWKKAEGGMLYRCLERLISKRIDYIPQYPLCRCTHKPLIEA